MNKPNIVRVVRYVRPKSNMRYSNLFGITFVFTIDYDKGEVLSQWSVCNGDNFDKEKGVDVARGKKCFPFSFSKVGKAGLVSALISELFNYENTDVMKNDYFLMHEVFKELARYANGNS